MVTRWLGGQIITRRRTTGPPNGRAGLSSAFAVQPGPPAVDACRPSGDRWPAPRRWRSSGRDRVPASTVTGSRHRPPWLPGSWGSPPGNTRVCPFARADPAGATERPASGGASGASPPGGVGDGSVDAAAACSPPARAARFVLPGVSSPGREATPTAPMEGRNSIVARQPCIAAASQRFSVSDAWIDPIMRTASSRWAIIYGRPVRSPAGAMGLMRVTPQTNVELRARRGLGGDPTRRATTFLPKPHAYARCLPLCRRVGHEAGALSPWLHRGLQRLGLDVVLLETRHVHAALKAQRNKTDRNDARGVAQLVRSGWYRDVHVRATTATGCACC